MDYRAGQGKPYFGPGGCHGNQPAPGNVGKRGRKIRGTFQVETRVFMANDNLKKRPPFLQVPFILDMTVEYAQSPSYTSVARLSCPRLWSAQYDQPSVRPGSGRVKRQSG